MIRVNQRWLMLLVIFVACFLAAPDTFAFMNNAKTGLPGESAIDTFIRFTSGPVAIALGVGAIMYLGYKVATGNLSDLSTGAISILGGVGLFIAAPQVMTLLFGGSIITPEEIEMIVSVVSRP